MKILKKGDIVVIVIIIVLSLIPMVFFKNEFNSDNAKIIVSQDSKIIGTYELNTGSNSQYIEFDFEMDGKKYKATLETKNSQVRLLRLPKEVVPKSIHADMSWIGDDSKIIVALPAKLVISIENSKNDSEIDSIAT
ncbi:hypothetical protein HMPREF9630_00485 [Peptoanaerobacter stomatis]|uniref:PF07009 family protein n=1 Tax=Peptoanaerobacter stomatis TaxID=796937 RepID=J6H8J5_9FIRM|nr:NusG domain II-containing protein [Peptoanaerobacter stomatis]EHL17318.1 hypothetical protein HMPREF9630_00485 [Peptoanaerobacter stomatis]EJU21535.1 PF07009 family protein [Peptoanaerobacter stomatis]NWO24709.1 NusG domain II-containing protein [Peptostreptococcaceae bacterium oral taxon 081]